MAAALVIGFVASGCAAQLRVPTNDDAALAQARWPGTSLADLQEGRQLYAAHCSSCHQLYRPDAYPAPRWQDFVDEMVGRAKLDARDARYVVRYLTTAAEASVRPPLVAARIPSAQR